MLKELRKPIWRLTAIVALLLLVGRLMLGVWKKAMFHLGYAAGYQDRKSGAQPKVEVNQAGNMQIAKQEVEALLKTLPDDCSMEDIQYHLYVIEKIKNGLSRAPCSLRPPSSKSPPTPWPRPAPVSRFCLSSVQCLVQTPRASILRRGRFPPMEPIHEQPRTHRSKPGHHTSQWQNRRIPV